MPGRYLVALGAGLLVAAPPISAQRPDAPGPLAVGVSVSTIGLGPEVSLHLSKRFGVRGGFHYFSLSFEDVIDEVRYEIRPDWRNLTALADVHPFDNAFRLTAGLVLWNTSAEGEGVLREAVEIGDRFYQPSEVGLLLGTADYGRSIAPLFGLGVAGRGRFAVTFDVGVVVAGRPTIGLEVDSPLTGAALAELVADVAQEEASIQQDIDDEALARLYPVISLGVKLRF